MPELIHCRKAMVWAWAWTLISLSLSLSPIQVFLYSSRNLCRCICIIYAHTHMTRIHAHMFVCILYLDLCLNLASEFVVLLNCCCNWWQSLLLLLLFFFSVLNFASIFVNRWFSNCKRNWTKHFKAHTFHSQNLLHAVRIGGSWCDFGTPNIWKATAWLT